MAWSLWVEAPGPDTFMRPQLLALVGHSLHLPRCCPQVSGESQQHQKVPNPSFPPVDPNNQTKATPKKEYTREDFLGQTSAVRTGKAGSASLGPGKRNRNEPRGEWEGGAEAGVGGHSWDPWGQDDKHLVPLRRLFDI